MTVSRIPNVEGGIQPTIVTAKGDLIAAIANASPGRLGVGSDGQLLTADSSSATGLSYQNNWAAGKNKIINGNFGVWQRGTTFTIATGGGAFTADRFEAINESGANLTTTRQTFTPGTAPVAGYEGEYFCRLVTTSATGDTYIVQRIEDVRSFAGQTVTVSFWAKCSTGTVSSNGYYLQGFGTGGSSTVFANLGAITITTSWQRFTQTIAIPSVSGKTIGANSSLTFQVLRYAASNTVDLWGVQVEAGSVATAFQTATGTIQGELAACQRYYVRTTATNLYAVFAMGYVSSTTQANFVFPLPVTMRVAPISAEAANLEYIDFNNGVGALSSPALSSTEISPQMGRIGFTITGGTAGRGAFVRASNNTAAYVGFSAEL